MLRCAIGLAVLGLACAGAPGWAQPLPEASLRLTCSADDGAVVADVDALQEFLAFAEAHDGQAVMVDVEIEAIAGAGGCPREAGEPGHHDPSRLPEAESARLYARGILEYRPCPDRRRAHFCGASRERLIVEGVGGGSAVSFGIALPEESALPRGLPYLLYGYGDRLRYRGPFILRHYSATGLIFATLDVPDPALDYVWSRAAENGSGESD